MIQAGRLNELITIQEETTSRGANGEQIVTWTAVVSSLPAQVRPIRGREFVALRAAQSDLSLEIKIRYRSGINNTMRVLWNGDAYDIVEVIAGGKRNRTDLTLMCSGASPDA